MEPYVDPARVPAVLDLRARDRQARPAELFLQGLGIDQIHNAFPNPKDENRVETDIAIHAMLRAYRQRIEAGLRDLFRLFRQQ